MGVFGLFFFKLDCHAFNTVNNDIFIKIGPFSASFLFIFVFSKQLIIIFLRKILSLSQPLFSLLLSFNTADSTCKIERS